jgi:hypothetical protein
MGGFGSTRWFMYTKKVTVKACRILDIYQWTRTELVQPNVRQAGSWTWAGAANVPIAALAYVVDTTDMAIPSIQLSYTVLPTQTHVYYAIALATIPVHRGGTRWDWLCPLAREGAPCNRRCEKLYLQPGGRYFGCRQCYNLTYRNSQEGHKYDQLAQMTRLRPRQVRHALAVQR